MLSLSLIQIVTYTVTPLARTTSASRSIILVACYVDGDFLSGDKGCIGALLFLKKASGFGETLFLQECSCLRAISAVSIVLKLPPRVEFDTGWKKAREVKNSPPGRRIRAF